MKDTTLNVNARAVLDVLQATDQHPTALEVYEAVRRVRPRIGLATVYRILRQLTEQGRISALGRDIECRYDARTQRHDHAVCIKCGALLDVPVDIKLSSETLREAAHAAGIALDSHEVRIYGRCMNCQRNNT